MVVLGIMAILFGIAIPGLSAYIHLSQFQRNDSYAKTMYLAAESSLTYHRTGGDWEDLALDIEQQGTQSFPDDDEKQSIYALRLAPGEYGEEAKSGDGALVAELLDTDIYDKSMLDAAICLEIDITSGQIYSVFYGTNCDGLYYSHEGGDHAGQLCIDGDKRDYDKRKAERLGYYSVEDTANMADLKPVRLKITSLNLLNDEALTLNWASNSKHQDLDVEYTINFYKKGDSSSPLMTISGLRLADLHGSTAPLLDVKLKSSTETSKYVFPLRYETGRFTLTLDAMMNADLTETLRQHPDWVPENSTSITRFAGFDTPMDIYATVKASPTYENMGDDASEYRESAETKSNEANTMFADNSTADKAGITAFRHLSNIRYINNASEFTVSTRTLDWNSSNVTVYGITTTQTPEGATGSSLTVQSAPAFPTVPELRADQSLDGSGGLLGRAVALLTGSNTIEGVKLDNTSTPSEPSNGQPKYLGLFAQNHGTISGLRMANAQLAVENGSYLGAGAVCGLSDGVLKSVSVAESSSIRASLTDTANQPHGIGGVIGVLKVAGSDKATGLFADGSVSGVLPAGPVSGGIGGIAGYADIAEGASLTDSENRASVTGNRSVGGIAGYAAAYSDTPALADCDNLGLVVASRDTTNDTGLALQFREGHCIGGIVGYAENVALQDCTSSAGRGRLTFEGTSADRQKYLIGRYVGGIVGYAEKGQLQNCSTGSGGYVLGDDYVGGIIGGLSGSTGSYLSSANVTTNASYVIGNTYVGGIIGSNSAGSVIERCVNTGVVAGYGKYIGGIVGENAEGAKITDCASYISDTHNEIYNLVTSWNAIGDFAGGIAGINRGAITFNDIDRTLSARSVSAIVVGRNFVGGVVGFNEGTLNATRYELIGGRVAASGDCVGGLVGLNASEALLDGDNALTIRPAAVSGRFFVGGAIGADVVALSKDTTLDHLTVSNSLGTISADGFCGGLIGYHRTYTDAQLNGQTLETVLERELASGTSTGLLPKINTAQGNIPTAVTATQNTHLLTITNAANTGTPRIASNDMTIAAGACAGGIVGAAEDNSPLLITNCLNKGRFRNTENSALKNGVNLISYLSASGYSDAANTLSVQEGSGFRAHIVGGIIGVNGRTHVIDRCENTGTMNGLTALGGVVGLNKGLVLNCTLAGSMGSATQDCVGGIVSLNVGSDGTITYITYNNTPYARGTVTACSTKSGTTVTGRRNVGGVAGINLNGGQLSANTCSANVTGAMNVGGVTGANAGTLTITGAVSDASRTVRSTGTAAGGLIGVNMTSGRLNTQVKGTAIIAADSQLTVRGAEKVGGIVGINRGTLSGTASALLVSEARLVRATGGAAGGAVGAQEGSASLSYIENRCASVIADKNTAGGIVAENAAESTVSQCSTTGGTISGSDGYASGIAAENRGTISTCTVANTKISSLGVQESGAVTAVNHPGAVIENCMPGKGVTLSGEATVAGALTGMNYGTVHRTDDAVKKQAAVISEQPVLSFSSRSLTVGGAVGCNSGGMVQKIAVVTSFKNFTGYKYLGGVTGENAAKGTVTDCSFSGEISQHTSASTGNCYGGIVGRNNARLTDDEVSGVTIDVTGVYTATATSTAAQKEELSAHIGGVAGKNDSEGEISGCVIRSMDSASSSIKVDYGMVGGVAGYNNGSITDSGDASTAALMSGVPGVASAKSATNLIVRNANASNSEVRKPDTSWLTWRNSADVEEMLYSSGGAVASGRSMQMIVSSNGNLGGITGYNAPTGAMERCASGNWLLVNKSAGIGVGTGGIIGMNETEKELRYLFNQSFVGRQLVSDRSDRFAGGIIGTQSNKTTENWTIVGCVNYGTVYCYHTHYSGGIIGQWTGNGGTIESCRNYGLLQTTFKSSWVGASGGIVAQLYHASSNQDFNILSCENHGSIYLSDGINGNGANDSAGILGNVTAYNSSNGKDAQTFTINVEDCVNGSSVKIYSSSMASGIVGFLSTDHADVNGVIRATQNIVLNINRCRNYAAVLQGGQYGNNYGTRLFAAGIFGDRYTGGDDKTYIQSCFSSTFDSTNTSTQSNNIVSLASPAHSMKMSPQLIGDNYFFDYSIDDGVIADGAQSTPTLTANVTAPKNLRTTTLGYARMVEFARRADNNQILALRGAPEPDNLNSTDGFWLPYKYTKDSAYFDKDGTVHSRVNGTITQTGHVLFELPPTYSDVFTNGKIGIGAKHSDLDTYIRTYYHRTERTTNGRMDAPDSVLLKQGEKNSFTVEITDDSRPLYYEGDVYVNGKPVLSGLRFIPREMGQGEPDSKGGYVSKVTTGSFTLSSELLQQTAGGEITIKVRAVSLFENVPASDTTEGTMQNTAFLPKPDVRIQLIRSGSSNTYRYTLVNAEDYRAFNDAAVTVQVDQQRFTLTPNAPSHSIAGLGVREMVATASASETNGQTPAPVSVNTPIFTPASGMPEIKPTFKSVSTDGTTLDDFTVTATLTNSTVGATTPPVYRVELVGTLSERETVFAERDVLIAAGSDVSVSFTGLPKALFSAQKLKVRAWYAASGLGPVYTYGEDASVGGQVTSVTYADPYDDEPQADKTQTVYSTVLANSGAFSDCIRTQNLSVTALPQPQLDPTAAIEFTTDVDNSRIMYYTFKWDTSTAKRTDMHYRVELTGISKKTDADGGVRETRVTIPTGEYYTTDTAHSLRIPADSWQFDSVELKVTRIGSGKQIGLSGRREYSVQQRLEAPGQPSAVNGDVNELVYTFSWPPISNETGLSAYELHAAGVSEPLATVQQHSGSDSVNLDLEKYAGQTLTLYLVAKAAPSSGFADSPNGVSLVLDVPSRIPAPALSWKVNWDANRAYTMDEFADGTLKAITTPQGTDQSTKTYLFRANLPNGAVYDVSQMTAASDGSYYRPLTGLDPAYAGRDITVYARISSFGGQVSSAWSPGVVFKLPKAKLDAPATVIDQSETELPVQTGASADHGMTTRRWKAYRTVISWPSVRFADVYELTLTNRREDGTTEEDTRIRILPNGVERLENGAWTTLTATDGVYTLHQGTSISGQQTGGSNSYFYTYSLDTLLTVKDGTCTLYLPNVSRLTDHNGTTVMLPSVSVQTVGVSVNANVQKNLTGVSDAYTASNTTRHTFN